MSSMKFMSQWTSQPDPIDSRWMKGEGYQIGEPPELNGKRSYDLDAWAVAWIKKNKHPVRESVTVSRNHQRNTLIIISIDWKHEALDEFDRVKQMEAEQRSRRHH